MSLLISLFLSTWSFALTAAAQTARSAGPASRDSRATGGAELDIIRIGDATHLEFNNAANWQYRVERVGADGVRIRLPKLSPAVVQKLRGLKDNLVTVQNVNEKAIDDTTEVSVKLASADIDFFEYTTTDPGKLIIDFFPKAPDLTKKPAPAKPAPKKLPPVAKKSIEIVEGGNRVPAGDFIANPENFQDKMIKAEVKYGLFDGGDPDFLRFSIADYEISEKSIIASRDNIYISFPMMDFESTTLEALIAAEPIYEIVPKEGNEENEEARLLLTLFKNKRNAVFLQQAQDFLEKYPETSYDEIVRFMMADTHYRMWMTNRDPMDFEASMGIYRSITERYPDSPLRNRTLLLMGYSFVDRGDSFTALTTFQRFNRLDPNSRYHDQVQLAIAQSYLRLGRYEDADRLLSELEKDGKTENVRWEAGFRKGDIYFKKKDFPKALLEYDAAIARYGKAASKHFPSTYYNTAEAKFQLKDFKASLMSYLEFLKSFPSHSHGGYAMTRVGELLDILGAPKKRVMGAYLESIFRFRTNPGASLARLRFLTGRFPDLKQKELDTALSEIDQLTKQMSALPDFQDVNELTTLVVSDGLTRRGDFGKAGQLLIQKYRQNPQSSSRDKYLKRIVHNITQEIKVVSDKADFIEALRIYSKNQGSWLKSNERIDTDYLSGVSYEQAGAYGEALKVYDKTYQRIALIKGTEAEKEHMVYEQLPSLAQLNLRIAAMNIQLKDYRAANDALLRIREDDLKAFAPKEIAERAELSSQIFEQKGDIQKAVAYLKELLFIWKEGKSASTPLRLRYARLLSQQGDAKSLTEAETSLAQIVDMREAGEAVEDDLFGQALELRGEVAIKRGERKEAIRHFGKLLDDFDGKRPLASIRYRLGRMQFDEGYLADAETTWKKLSEAKDGVWKRLAQEQMSSEKWRTEYKKYIDRIPAATAMGSKKQ